MTTTLERPMRKTLASTEEESEQSRLLGSSWRILEIAKAAGEKSALLREAFQRNRGR